MKSKKLNPPAATGGLGVYCDRQAAKFHDPENNQPHAKMQDFRAIWLARRFAISPDMAMLLATLALGEVRA
ncbi:MAG: hypothetical protein ACLPSW_31185 [Roseiarcus sp.]